MVYGFWHQATLDARAKKAEAEREYRRKEKLIEQAKAEYRKRHAPAESKTTGGGMSCVFGS